MKKLLLIITIFVLIIISGCGGDVEPVNTGDISDNVYSTSQFSIEVETDWDVQDEFTSEYPGDAIVVIRNNVKENTFIANVNVSHTTLDDNESFNDFTKKIMNTHKKTIVNFKEIASETLSITVNGAPAESKLNIFEGKPNPDAETLRFIQTYGYKGKTAFIATGIYNISEDKFVKEKVENMIRSFKIK